MGFTAKLQESRGSKPESGSSRRRAAVVAQYFFAADRFAPLLCLFEYEAQASASAAWETTKS